jgi:hypothetical protein
MQCDQALWVKGNGKMQEWLGQAHIATTHFYDRWQSRPDQSRFGQEPPSPARPLAFPRSVQVITAHPQHHPDLFRRGC